MKEYIEREAAINTINKLRICLREKLAYNYDLGAAEAKLRIEAVPAADVVEVRRGRWDRLEACDRWQCSECGVLMDIEGTPVENLLRYRPNCGAKMYGGVNDGRA